MVARSVRVHGYVQGVAFRATCQWEAQARGVTGWARNEPDGTVSAWFEGEPKAVDAMVEWCRRGPRASSRDAAGDHRRCAGRTRDFAVG